MSDRSAPRKPLTSPDDQGATFVELFFDLVFVFAISRLTHQLGHRLGWSAVGPTIVVGWLIWWAWTQFTWTLNSANTNRHDVRLVTLIATGLVFLMAASVDQAFGDGPAWFAIPYVLVRIVGLGLYDRVARDDPHIQGGVRLFTVASMAGLAAVLVGAALPSPARFWVWGAAFVLDLGAGWVAGRHKDWHLRIEHFAERHGLILIIALGEALIVSGVAVADQPRDAALVRTGLLATAATCLLWWTYFGWVKDAMEHGVDQAGMESQVGVARDSYSFCHFPIVFGVVGFAAGLYDLTLHIHGLTSTPGVYTLAIGLVLFVGATALALRRATGVLLTPRLAILAATAIGVALAAGQSATLVLAIVCGGLTAIILVEHLRPPSCKLAGARERRHTS